jgi:hypothetical protein
VKVGHISHSLANILEICNDLRVLPEVLFPDDASNLLSTIREKAVNMKVLVNWLDHKDKNPWVLKCLSYGSTKMSRADWFSTSFTTNIAESAHAQSQRDGVRLSLVGAIQRGMAVDTRYFEAEAAMHSFGIGTRYGNTAMSGRMGQNLTRKKNKAKKNKKDLIDENTLAMAQELIKSGVSAEVVENFLNSKTNKE